MRQTIIRFTTVAAVLAIFLSACVPSQPTPDAAAISTAAAQTVEARFTELAAAFTATPQPPTETPVPQASPTLAGSVTDTPEPLVNGKPCYFMTFLGDVTIPDGMIIAPGATFTKTWRVRNDGNCPWDSKYSLALQRGEPFGTVTQIPLTRTVNPGDSTDFSIEMTAPTAEGDYAGFWHLATPFGGFVGIGTNNQALVVKIKVTSKPEREFGAVSVVYDWTRRPATGCGKDGAYYDFRATITANGAGILDYRWDRNPFDGVIEGGTLNYSAAGVKTVNWTWHMTPDRPQDIDRWVSITTIVGSKETNFGRITFNFTCK